MRRIAALLAALALPIVPLAGCSSDPGGAPDAGSGASDGGTGGLPSTIGPAERPARFVVPGAHDGTTPLPLMVLLHGYSASAAAQDVYWRASTTARARGYYLILPDGLVDSRGNHYWNATPRCCDFDRSGVDDVAYLESLLDEAESLVPVDTTRVYFYGHSNGGFMSYRLACELSDRVTAIAGLAGGDYASDTDCVPDRPVSVLHVHGSADGTVAFAGVAGPAGHPSARDAVVRWAGRAGCDTTMSTPGEPLDLVTNLDGAETTVERFDVGCMEGLDAELWTIEGGGHIPAFGATWSRSVADWLLAHQR